MSRPGLTTTALSARAHLDCGESPPWLSMSRHLVGRGIGGAELGLSVLSLYRDLNRDGRPAFRLSFRSPPATNCGPTPWSRTAFQSLLRPVVLSRVEASCTEAVVVLLLIAVDGSGFRRLRPLQNRPHPGSAMICASMYLLRLIRPSPFLRPHRISKLTDSGVHVSGRPPRAQQS